MLGRLTSLFRTAAAAPTATAAIAATPPTSRTTSLLSLSAPARFMSVLKSPAVQRWLGERAIEHLGRALAKLENLPDHVEETGRDEVLLLREHSLEAERSPLDVVGGQREGHVGALGFHAELAEEADEVRIGREVEHLRGEWRVEGIIRNSSG
mgnify:CR=1 FL=1